MFRETLLNFPFPFFDFTVQNAPITDYDSS